MALKSMPSASLTFEKNANRSFMYSCSYLVYYGEHILDITRNLYYFLLQGSIGKTLTRSESISSLQYASPETLLARPLLTAGVFIPDSNSRSSFQETR